MTRFRRELRDLPWFLGVLAAFVVLGPVLVVLATLELVSGFVRWLVEPTPVVGR